MAEKKGFDLSSIFSAVSNSDTIDHVGREQIEYIDIDLIDDDPNNFYALTDLEELASNIQLCGLQQPIRVRTGAGGRVTIVSGHRRRSALRLLIKEGLEQYRSVPCIRERDSGSAALQELKLIYANSDTRKLTSAEISKQAERVEALLYQLKVDGYAFPGRMRDHVAEACKVSKSKLARLKVIRENLIPEFMQSYESGELVESVAYALAKQSENLQKRIRKAWKGELTHLQEWKVRDYVNAFDSIFSIKECSHGEKQCNNHEAMWDRYAEPNTYHNACNRCCGDCYNKLSCKAVCPKFKDDILADKRKQREANKVAKQEEKERDEKIVQEIKECWTRFGEARRAAGVSIEDVFKVLGLSYYGKWADEEWRKSEDGENTTSVNSDTPYSRSRPQQVAALAKLLGVSLDYLFLATDDPIRNAGGR